MSDAICHKCNETISQRIVTALGKSWHPEHFACRECGKPISESTFNIHENEPVCSDCFVQKYSGTCFACKQPITEKTIKALGNTYHDECFKCNGPCNGSLVGTSFYERDGKAFCKADYETLFAAKCAGCSKSIIDNAIIALNVKWHKDCFKCKKCENPISASTFAVEDNKPVCTSCSA